MDKCSISKKELLCDALDSYKKEYRELVETWQNLDGKAQGVISVSGIFVAGMLAFIRALLQSVAFLEQCLLTVSACLLVFSIILALSVQRLRAVSKSPQGELFESLVNDLVEFDDDQRSQLISGYLRDQIKLWREVNCDVHDVNENKAKKLLWAQVLLVLAILCVVLYTLVRIWSM